MVKNIILLFILICLFFSAIAQDKSDIDLHTYPVGNSNVDTNRFKWSYLSSDTSTWWDFVRGVRSIHEDNGNDSLLNDVAIILYPNKVVTIDSNGVDTTEVFKAGFVFSPSDPFYGFKETLPFVVSYFVDTIVLPYSYVRNVDSIQVNNSFIEVVDTLCLEFYMVDQLNLTFQHHPDDIYFTPEPDLDSFNGLYSPSKYMLKIPLNSSDRTNIGCPSQYDFSNMVLSLDSLGVLVKGNAYPGDRLPENIFGISFFFKPMAELGTYDTLFCQTCDSSVLNNWLAIKGLQNNSPTKWSNVRAYNSSFWLTRYNIVGFESYLGGTTLNHDMLLHALVFTSCNGLDCSLSSTTLAIENDINVFPNPVIPTRSVTINLPESIHSGEEVMIRLVDVNGVEVSRLKFQVTHNRQVQFDMGIVPPKSKIYTLVVESEGTIVVRRIVY